MNFKISYISLAQVFAEKLWINESRGWFFHHGGAAVNSFSVVIGSLQFNMKCETGYVCLAQVVAAKL